MQNLKIFTKFGGKFDTFVHYFLIVLSFELNNAVLCHFCSNEWLHDFFLEILISFSESGAYNRGGAYIKIYGSEVVLAIEVVLTFKRAYN